MEINSFENIPGLRSIVDTQDENKDKTELGQNEFLKLMTVQLANQDPLQPMENGDFMGQIAQFGTVNGITDLLASFKDLAANLQSSQALQASNLIGRQVLVNLDQGYLPQDGTLVGAATLDSSSSDVAVNIFDNSGEVLARVELGAQPAGVTQFSWDGTTLGGQKAPPGRYRIEVEATFGGVTESITPQVIDNVRSLTLGSLGKEMQVELENLGSVSFNQVNQIQ
ncbi:Flagellar basal-body rod modification protein FlgD [hydrothermal vent metagenome]|uniref:Flagellar basal-body rod modification protein FlgD n=1 Tax=hydrothermal vent metagenome TaxID=652676 RepID=A0A3B0X832_9ZZZZ